VDSGFINLHKPLGWTSHDCVAKVRRLLHTKKVGHGGTLDPAASGVLPIAFGRATRLLNFLPDGKAYRAVIRFGVTTATDDLEGAVLSSQPVPELTEAQAIAPLPSFLGTLTQIPPTYSAVQVQGRRLYDLARQGQAVTAPARTVTIHRIEGVGWQPGDFPELTVTIACGPGTYIRALARDWGAQLGVGATLAALVRTHSSGFELADSITLEALADAIAAGSFTPVSPGTTLKHLPVITLEPELARRWQQGQKIPLSIKDLGSELPVDDIAEAGAIAQVRNGPGDFLGVSAIAPGEVAGQCRLRPKMVFVPLG
jgi:tRNA pseudouridine55 synthase